MIVRKSMTEQLKKFVLAQKKIKIETVESYYKASQKKANVFQKLDEFG